MRYYHVESNMWQQRKLRLALLLASVLVHLGESRLFAQPERWRAGISLDFEQLWTSPDYGEPSRGMRLVLVGDPSLLRIGIANPFFDGRDAVAESDWASRIVLTIREGSVRQALGTAERELACSPGPISKEGPQQELDGVVVLSRTGRQFYRCDMDTVAGGLSSGLYTITVRWSNDDEMVPLRRRTGVGGVDALGGAIDFELRAPESAADHADLALRRGVDHLYAGRFDAADEELSRVLSANRQSAVALYFRGVLRAKQGRCTAAKADMELSARSLELGLDRRDRNPSHRTFEQRQAAAARRRGAARTLGCQSR